MGTEENYLDNLLKSITDPEENEPESVTAEESIMEQISEIKEEIGMDEPMEEEMKLIPEPDEVDDTATDGEEITIAEPVLEELEIAEVSEEPEIPDISEVSEELEIADISEMPELLEVPEELEITEIPEELEIAEIPEEPDISEVSEEPEIPEELEITEILKELEISEEPEIPEELEITEIPEELEIAEETEMPEELEMPKMFETNDAAELSGLEGDTTEEEFKLDDLQDSDALEAMDEIEIPSAEFVQEPDNALDISDIDDLNIPEIHNDEMELQLVDALDIEEPEDTVQTETELEMPDELNLEELDLDTPNIEDDLGILDSIEDEKDSMPGVDDGLDDVLSMLDDDADLAEINDILKKSDSNEPIQDEMMDLLNQMADDEAALVNAGVKNIEEDGGVPIPDMPSETSENDNNSEEQKVSKKKKNSEAGEKKPGAFGKLFNLLTEELPGPTEADYAAEAEKKAAQKQEAQTKKEEEKLAKEEEKQAKAEEKEAAKKAKAEAAAQKKKEKQAAKEKKAAEKLAKQGPIKKAKRIPPKKIAAVAVFGASVFGSVIVAANVLSNQGYINVAKKAYYDGDYKGVYLATYGMNLRDSDALIKEKSKVILKMQRWYDSYQNNQKLGREREALDALIRGLESYDYINADAEAYGVLNEVNSIKGTILSVLQSEYGLSEEQAKDLLNYEDALDYTIALNSIITGQ